MAGEKVEGFAPVSETRDVGGKGRHASETTPDRVASYLLSMFGGYYAAESGLRDKDQTRFQMVGSRDTDQHERIMWCTIHGMWSSSASEGRRYIQSTLNEIWSIAFAQRWHKSDLHGLVKRLTIMETPAFEAAVTKQLASVAKRNGIEALEDTDFNRDRFCIGTPLGVIDMRTLRLLPPEAAKPKLVTKRSAVMLRESANPEVADILTAHLEPEVREFVWAQIGFSMLGRPRRRLAVFSGKGGTGKSLLCNALLAALGDYGSRIPRGSLTRTKQGGEYSSNAAVAEAGGSFVDGIRLACMDEPDNAPMDVSRLKELSGSKTLKWRRLRGHWRTSLITATPMIFSNDLSSMPRMGMHDEALVSRLVEIPFPVIPDEQKEANKHIKERIEDDDFKEGLFLRMVLEAQKQAKRVDDGDDEAPPLTPMLSEGLLSARRRESGDIQPILDRIEKKEGRILTLDDVWAVWADISGESDDRKTRIGGFEKRAFRRYVERWNPDLAAAYGQHRDPEDWHTRRRGWIGYRLMSADAFQRMKEREQAQEEQDGSLAEAQSTDDIPF